jgi:hypothetical protein
MARITFTAGQVLAAADVNEYLVNNGELRDILYYTSSGTFSKADYPYLSAIRVKVQAGGGGGGGAEGTISGNATSTSKGGNGGGAGYAEAFVLASSLSDSETVTVGAGGTGGAANSAGGAGGSSSFGTVCAADGGGAGVAGPRSTHPIVVVNGSAGSGTTGDLLITGADGPQSMTVQSGIGVSFSGSSVLGAGKNAGISQTQTGTKGNDYGGGGTGASSQAQNVGRAGGAGGDGIVIVELYA